jgi:predicted RNA binding protein YcfA (HicA-like mRNA interferase family)
LRAPPSMKRVSGKRLCRILEAKGWKLERISGSHHIYSRRGIPEIITVPVHATKDLKTGTQRSIMTAAELIEEDL